MVKRIASEELRVGMFIHKLGGSWLQHPFLRGSFLLTDPADIKRIIQSGIKVVWIDEAKSQKNVDDTVAALKKSDVIGDTATQDVVETSEPSEQEAVSAQSLPKDQAAKKPPPSKRSMDLDIEKAKKLCQTAKPEVMAMFDNVRLGKAIDPESTLPLVGEIDELVERNAAAILSVARLKTHDDYTYMHSVAVCALMLALARQLNLEPEQVKLAGVGGLMHDLGKALMPLEVLNKPGKLTDDEFAIMRKHPAAGAKILQDGGADNAIVDIALHHHEKMNGLGYPHGLKDDDITLLARMGAICDVYDAVTSQRAYKKPWCPANSIREMARWEGHFDKTIFNAFVKSVGIYPVGSLVRLTSQRLAVVIEPGDESLLKPIVRIFYSLKPKQPIPIQTLDLGGVNCKDSIEGPEDFNDWDFKNLDNLWQ